jgi:hypothetical protein
MPKVIFISRALDGQTQPRATPVRARFIPSALSMTKLQVTGRLTGPFTRQETAGEAVFF